MAPTTSLFTSSGSHCSERFEERTEEIHIVWIDEESGLPIEKTRLSIEEVVDDLPSGGVWEDNNSLLVTMEAFEFFVVDGRPT